MAAAPPTWLDALAAPPADAAEVLRFWYGDTDAFRGAWFARDDAFDADIRARFGALFERAASGALDEEWAATPLGAVALVIVLEQFSRNMFRGSARAFSADARALAVAKRAVARGLDKGLSPLKAMFLYLPFEHSESLEDQARSVELMSSLGVAQLVDFAEQHRVVVERFGRFPHRNAVLGRESTPEEVEFLKTHKGF